MSRSSYQDVTDQKIVGTINARIREVPDAQRRLQEGQKVKVVRASYHPTYGLSGIVQPTNGVPQALNLDRVDIDPADKQRLVSLLAPAWTR